MFYNYTITELPDGSGVEIEFHHTAGSWVVRLPRDLAARMTRDLFELLSVPGPAAPPLGN